MGNEKQSLLYEDIKLSLFSNLCNATGVYRRSFPNKQVKEKFQENAVETIKDLISKVDTEALTNDYIRKKIIELAKLSGFDDKIGTAQKVVNVYLKYYCAVANKSQKIMKELDCPIDSLVRKDNKLPNISIKDMDFDDYVKNQDLLEAKYGMRVMADIPSYDKRKIY